MTGYHRLLMGPTGSGKTWAAWRMVKAWPGVVLYVDPKGTDSYLRECAQLPDGLVFTDFRFFAGYRPKPRIAMLRSSLGTDVVSEAEQLFDWLVDAKLSSPEFRPVPLLIVVDEAWRFMKQYGVFVPPLEQLVHEGRGYEVSVVVLNQHPKYVPTEMRLNLQWSQVFPGVSEDGKDAALSGVMLQWWERNFGPVSKEDSAWLSVPHRSMATDGAFTYWMETDGSKRRAGEVEHDAEAEDQGAGDGDDGPGPVRGVEEPPEAGEDGGGSGRGDEDDAGEAGYPDAGERQ